MNFSEFLGIFVFSFSSRKSEEFRGNPNRKYRNSSEFFGILRISSEFLGFLRISSEFRRIPRNSEEFRFPRGNPIFPRGKWKYKNSEEFRGIPKKSIIYKFLDEFLRNSEKFFLFPRNSSEFRVILRISSEFLEFLLGPINSYHWQIL